MRAERIPKTPAGCDLRAAGGSARTSGARSSRGTTTLLAALRACVPNSNPNHPSIRRASLGLASRGFLGCALLALVGTFLLACGGSPKQAAKPTPDPIRETAGPSCKDVATHLATLADRDPTKDPSADTALRTHCENDHWSDEARSCFATANADDEVDGCKTKLTAEQQSGFPAAKKAAAKDTWDSGDKTDKKEDNGNAKKKGHTRGPVPKDQGKSSSDPCEGGE